MERGAVPLAVLALGPWEYRVRVAGRGGLPISYRGVTKSAPTRTVRPQYFHTPDRSRRKCFGTTGPLHRRPVSVHYVYVYE
jgi:hypothetical protein